MSRIIGIFEIFMTNLSPMIGVFKDYTGNDYCQGMIFAINGVRMLTRIAMNGVAMAN